MRNTSPEVGWTRQDTYLFTDSIREVFSIFEASEPITASHQSYQVPESYSQIKKNALRVQGLQHNTDHSCVLCGDSNHSAARCGHFA